MTTAFRIKPKRDFGNKKFLINGRYVNSGFVVTDGVCNVMPAATWFETIQQALFAIDCLLAAGSDSALFWKLIHNGDYPKAS
jgi:hypothetical protein